MSYTAIRLNISDGQKRRVKQALKSNDTLTLRFDNNDLKGGDDLILLTKTQINNIRKAVMSGKGANIKMSKTQIKRNIATEGGFLGALLGAAARFLPMIATKVLPALGVGALSGLASTGVQKAFGDGLYIKKGGCVCQIEPSGDGLYLKAMPKDTLGVKGDGLYLKKGRQTNPVGSGIVEKIPIIGPLVSPILKMFGLNI